jgi:hypothetical protein
MAAAALNEDPHGPGFRSPQRATALGPIQPKNGQLVHPSGGRNGTSTTLNRRAGRPDQEVLQKVAWPRQVTTSVAGVHV